MRTEHADNANPTHARGDWPAAVIAGAYQTGVLGVRSLVRRGVRAVCFDCDRSFPGFRSAYGAARACPNPDTHPDAWVEFMIELSRTLGGMPVLIPSADQFVSAISAHATRLSGHYRLSPGIALQGRLATKETQYALAAEHGMPMPRTQFATTLDDVTSFARDAAFPCLLKPIHFREWQAFPAGHALSYAKISIAQTPHDLIESWRRASVVNPNVILQEIIQGPDTAKRVYFACYDRDGRRIANAMFRELRCLPAGFGPATVSEPVIDPETDEVCDGFLRRIGYSGICEIEMKWDSRDGRVKLIEANPRLTGGGDAAPHAGVDVCWLHYLDMIGRTVTPVGPNDRQFRHVVLRSEVASIIENRRAGLISWGDVARSYRPPLAFYDLDRGDWRYSAETILRMARSAVGGVARAFLPKRSQSTR